LTTPSGDLALPKASGRQITRTEARAEERATEEAL
jgi:hypothetical protein